MLPSTLPPALVETSFEHLGERYRGKVRDVYRPGDGRVILITTDRISAFDHVLRQAIPLKGQVLNQLAAFFFEQTKDISPNHLLDIPDPNVAVAIECQALPVEFVVRGYMAGHAWRVYQQGRRELCSESLPDGLRESERLPQPILTPATKAEEGHDEDISKKEIVDQGILDAPTLEEAADLAFKLFTRGTELASKRGLILVDTKYEFGSAPDGRLLVIDEVHTPDSSRYYYADGYEQRLSKGETQRQLSKEFVREWLMEKGFQGLDEQVLPDLPSDFVRQIAERYVELYETITGSVFKPELSEFPVERINNALEIVLSYPQLPLRLNPESRQGIA